MNSVQSFAIIPAAGLSRRMGSPKLLLPWRGIPIIQHVLSAWIDSRVTRVCIVIRKSDEPLLKTCRKWEDRVTVIIPETDPPDMKSSVQHALTHIRQNYRPTDCDVWMLAPADMPRNNSSLINQVLAKYDPKEPTIILPEVDGRRGHPVLFPWPLSDEIRDLPPQQGINAIVRRHPVRTLTVDDSRVFDDIDTALDYERLTAD